MSFLNPFLLLGLLAIAVPLIIHLIQLRRPKKVRFSTLAFFKSLQESAIRRIRMKQWLLLALRMLAILMLAIALARPFLPSGFGPAASQDQPKAVGIVIDNSPSMEQVDQYGPYINQVKRIASEIIEQSNSEDRFFIEVTNGAALELPGMPAGSARARIGEIETLNSGNFSAENLSGLNYRLDNAPQQVKQLYFLTDGQGSQIKAFADDFREAPETDIRIITVGEGTQSNSAITGLELEHSGLGGDEPVTVRVRVKNFGNDGVQNHYISLEQSGELAGQHAVQLSPQEEAEYQFEVLPDGGRFINGTVVLEGDELTFDNRRYFTIRIPELRRVLLMNREETSSSAFPSYLNAVMSAAAEENRAVELVRHDWGADIFSDPEGWDAIVLDGVELIPEYLQEELVTYVQQGGGIFFLPSASGDISSYNRFLERTNTGRFANIQGSYGSFAEVDRVEQLREGHPVLEGIFDKTEEEDLRINLPELYYYYLLESSSSGGSYTILSSSAGFPILLEQQVGAGRLLVASIGADPGWSNLPVKPIFAPLIYRSVLYLATSDAGGLNEHILGEVFSYQLSGQPEEIVIEAGEQSIVPDREVTHQGVRVRDGGRDWTPGWITIRTDDSYEVVALNQDTMESDFSTLSREEIGQLLNPLFRSVTVRSIAVPESEMAEHIQTGGFGVELWYWFIMGAIFLLFAESLVSRMFKAESNL